MLGDGAIGGRGPRNHRQSRRGAWAGAGTYRGDDRLPRQKRGGRGQCGAAATRADHAPVSQGDGGKSRPAVLSTGNLQDDRGVGSNTTAMLPGAPGDRPQAIPVATPNASGAAGAAGELPYQATVTETATRYGFWHL